MNEDCVLKLNERRDELTEESNNAIKQNEELKASAKASKEIAKKQLATKMKRDQSEKIKDLLAQEEMVLSLNEETGSKLADEKDKFDTLKAQRIELETNLANKRLTLKADELYNKETGVILQKLIAEIAKLDTVFDKKVKEDVEEKKVNGEESKKNRNLLQKKSALVAKTNFIEENYDYSSNVTNMGLETFRKIQESNTEVRQQSSNFLFRSTVNWLNSWISSKFNKKKSQ